MFKSYLITAWQNLLRNKLFALINIVGLAIGFAVFTLILIYIKSEYSWDRQWENADRIYTLTDHFTLNEQIDFKNPQVLYPVATAMKEYFPDQIEYFARRYFQSGDIRVDDEVLESAPQGGIFLVEESFIDIYNLNVVSGSLENTLASPYNLALSEDQASIWLGEGSRLQQTITLEIEDTGPVDFQVTAIFSLPEGSTSLNIAAFSLLEENAYPHLSERMNSWTDGFTVITDFLLKQGVNADMLNQQTDALVDQYYDEPWLRGQDRESSDVHQLEFINLGDTHFDQQLRGDQAADKSKLLTFAVIAVMVLLIACVNFVILATAKAQERKKEVGIRKVLGAGKAQLVRQYIGESVILSLVALVLSLLIAYILAPVFSTLIAKDAPLNIFTISGVAILMAVSLLAGFLGGLYPAFVLSSFDAVKIFRNHKSPSIFSRIGLRNLLVCIQFAIAIILIIGTLVIYRQISFYTDMDPGFNQENLLLINLDQNSQDRETPLINELETLSGVEEIAMSSMPPNRMGSGLIFASSYNRLRSEENSVDFTGSFVGYNFFETYQFPLLAGRFFDPLLDPPPPAINPEETDTQNQPPRVQKLVINRTFSDALGFASPEDAPGQHIYQPLWTEEGTEFRASEIIGVFENARYQSLREKTGSEAYQLGQENFWNIIIKFSPSVKDTIREDVERVWTNVVGETAFNANFVEQNVDIEFTQEKNDGKLLLTFATLSIFIASIGLFGLASFTIKTRTREIGIRKVLGANSGSILNLFIWRFSLPVFAAIIIASPLAFWLMLKWLQGFADQPGYISLVPLFIITAVMVIIVAALTVAATTYSTARMKPVNSLRYE